MMKFEILQDLDSPKAVQHGLFCDWLRYLLLFGLCGAIKAADKKCY